MSKDPAYASRGFLVLIAVVFLASMLLASFGAAIMEASLIAVVLVLPLLLARWMFVDATRHGMNEWTWGILGYVFPLVALVVYLIVRTGARDKTKPA